MKYTVTFSEGAEIDVIQVYSWYRNISVSLAEEFLECLEKSTLLISQFPFGFPLKSHGLRESQLIKFPFILIYRIKRRHIYIHAVFHTSRNPDKKEITKRK
jgi:toxin ParE1/3/4